MTQEEQRQCQVKKHVIITKCLSDPCPRFYTDTLSQSILIECKNPRHKTNTDTEKVEEKKARLPGQPIPTPNHRNIDREESTKYTQGGVLQVDFIIP
jgi:hypothetical protein